MMAESASKAQQIAWPLMKRGPSGRGKMNDEMIPPALPMETMMAVEMDFYSLDPNHLGVH